MVRTVAFLRGREGATIETHTMRMQQRLDVPEGREQYGQRFATRFTLRGRTKVHGKWLLLCSVHHIEKLIHAGYAA